MIPSEAALSSSLTSISIKGLGLLRRTNTGLIIWRAPGGVEHTITFDSDGDVYSAIDSVGRTAILASDLASEVYALDSSRGGQVRLEQRLRRYDDPIGGLRYVRLVSLDDGVLLIYEQGVTRFDEAGWLRWKVEHFRIDWWFDHVDQSTVWLRDQEKPANAADRNLTGYRLADGASVGGRSD